MNRLSDLKNTLPRNIEDNKEYDNAEFIVLDYNSTENVEGWIKRKMMHHIKSGKLKAIKVLGHWRIKKEELDRLINSNKK